MKTDIKNNIYVSLFFMILSILYLIATQQISVFSPFGKQGLDSKSIPLIIGWGMLILSILLLIITFLRYQKEKDQTIQSNAPKSVNSSPKETPSAKQADNHTAIRLLASLILLCLYILAYQPLGFILSSIAYLIAQSLLITPADKRKKWTLFIILFSIFFTLLVYIIFSKYLTLFLPSGLLG